MDAVGDGRGAASDGLGVGLGRGIGSLLRWVVVGV